jgi:hypothetical protein
MQKQDWIATFKDHKNNLRNLVVRFHPSSKSQVLVADSSVEVPSSTLETDFKITAASAEEACEVVRQKILSTKPHNPVLIFDTAANDPIDTALLIRLLNETWFGLPESASVRKLPGFYALCDLCEGIDTEEDTE